MIQDDIMKEIDKNPSDELRHLKPGLKDDKSALDAEELIKQVGGLSKEIVKGIYEDT